MADSKLFTESVLVVNQHDPLRSLVVAAALCVDTALKQDQRGFN